MAKITRYRDRDSRPPFAWSGSREVKLRLEAIKYSGDNDFVIAEASLLPYAAAESEMGKRIEIGVSTKGTVPGATQGTTYDCTAKWIYVSSKKDPKWSEWMLVIELGQAADPDNEEGIIAYLTTVDHVGPARSVGLCKAWGKETMKILDAIVPQRIVYQEGDDIERVVDGLDIPEEQRAVLSRNGLGGERLLEFLNSYQGTRKDYAHYLMLKVAGARGQVRKRILEAYHGQNLKDAINRDPLDLLDIDGVEFVLADRLWGMCGIDPRDPRRIGAGVAHAIMEESRFGHCYVNSTKALNEAAGSKILAMPELPTLWFTEKYEDMPEIQRSIVVDEFGNMWARRIWNAEQVVADRVSALSAGVHKIRPDVRARSKDIVDQILRETEFTPGTDQRAALDGALSHTFEMLIGSAGCGKTTLTKLIIAKARRMGLRNILMMAPTGAAARRAHRATGIHATTIHRGFGIAGSGPAEFDEANPIDADMIIFDEVSMLDIYLAGKALSGIRAGTYVLFVGDSKQLAAVGPGAVLRDLMASRVVPTYELTEPHRNSGQILRMAYSTLDRTPFMTMDGNGENIYPDLIFDPLNVHEDAPDHEVAQRIVDKVVAAYLQVGDPNKVKAIVSYNGEYKEHPDTLIKGYWDGGVRHQNNAIANAMVPPQPRDVVLENDHFVFRRGHRCLWTKNTSRDDPLAMVNGQDFDIQEISKNDDGAVMIGITTENDEGDVVTKKFAWEDYKGDFELGYARSVNKAQGSGYDVVIVSLMRGKWLSMENAYTSVTRAQKELRLVGYPERLWNTQPENPKRRTMLASRLQKLMTRKEAAA